LAQLSESKKRGPGRLLRGRQIVLGFTHRGNKHKSDVSATRYAQGGHDNHLSPLTPLCHPASHTCRLFLLRGCRLRGQIGLQRQPEEPGKQAVSLLGRLFKIVKVKAIVKSTRPPLSARRAAAARVQSPKGPNRLD